MKKQTISFAQRPVKVAIYFCLFMILGLCTDQMQAQSTERTVSGVIQTEEGVLPYAAVVLKGTSVGVATDENGAFTFPQKLKENDVLLFSFLGYEDQEITITGDTTYIEPFLEGIPLVIVAALRTAPSMTSTVIHKN